jgi:hypothetical protein
MYNMRFVFGVHHRQYAALGPAGMIAKTGHLAVIVPDPVDQPSQDAHGIPQQGRIPRRMDIAFDAGAENVAIVDYH